MQGGSETWQSVTHVYGFYADRPLSSGAARHGLNKSTKELKTFAASFAATSPAGTQLDWAKYAQSQHKSGVRVAPLLSWQDVWAHKRLYGRTFADTSRTQRFLREILRSWSAL